ncbi:hypothetical protein [Cohnella sp.]|uniref:hypothetical protein n=1 Tax=Cohnella sp. TaxID=1883426 RepID=UPI00356329D1
MSSFISNFRKMRLYSFGLIGFFLLINTSEVTVFRNLDFYGLSSGFIGQFSEMDKSLHSGDPSKITTAVFGDSMSIDALRSDYLAEAAGRSKDSFYNFSISGGKGYDIYKTYQKYQGELIHLKEAIVVVNEHQLNSYNMEDDVKFKYYSGLKDRIRIMNWDNYGELLAGWALKSYDMRTIWAKMFDSYREGKLKNFKPRAGGLTPQAPDPTDPEYMMGKTKTVEIAENTAERWFEGYNIKGLQSESLENLLRNLHDDGVRIHILQIPRTQRFEDAVRSKYTAEQQQYLDLINGWADKYDAEFTIMSNEGLTLEKHFRDTNHVTPQGARIVTARVAEALLK